MIETERSVTQSTGVGDQERRNFTVVAFLWSDDARTRANMRQLAELSGGVLHSKPQIGLGFIKLKEKCVKWALTSVRVLFFEKEK